MNDVLFQARSSRHRTETPLTEGEGASLPPAETAAQDFIYGAENIASFMGVSVRKVYYFRECKKDGAYDIPINKIPGLGLCANRRALIDYLSGDRQAKPHQTS